MKDYYKILEVEPNAPLEQIKSQHRFLIHAWHPDKFPDGELKDKAQEKIREINEAYGVLSDSSKRENYDNLLHSYSPTPAQAAPSHQSTSNSQSGQSKEHCQSCGLPVETQYVEFYENVGMIFMRQHRNAKGNFCKSCIDYYFWNFTGKTILLGWWGTISFIVTPFILFNNFLRFIFTLGMKKFPLSITPNPSPFWVFTTLGGVAISGFFLFSMFGSVLSLPTSSYASSPTTTAVVPTRVPTKVKTPTPTSNCIQWSRVTSSMIGRQACVYGTIYKTRDVIGNFQILFSNNQNDFFLATGTYYYEVVAGDCVVAEGEILKSGAGVPYINIDEALYTCEPWMN